MTLEQAVTELAQDVAASKLPPKEQVAFNKAVSLHKRVSRLLTDYPLRTFLMAGVAHQPLLFGAAR